MENRTASLYMLVFCYAVFSFAVYIPDSKMNLYSWLAVFGIAVVLKIIFLFLIRNGRNLKSVSKFFKVYSVFLLSFQTNKIFRYLRLYHYKNAEAIVFITILIILIFVVFKDISFYRYAKPLFWFSVALIATIIALNINKANVYNLFSHSRTYGDFKLSSITLFDYIIPMCLIQNSIGLKEKYNLIKIILIIDFLIMSLIFFIYLCFRGNIVYSISPLQLIFQLSGSKYIINFDAMYSFIVIMLYIASIILILWSIKETDKSNNDIKYGILLFYIIAFGISFFIKDFILSAIHLVGIIMFLGGKRHEKN